MSVRKDQRRTSPMEFHHTALKIQAELTGFAETNFGIHPKIRKVKEIKLNPNMTEEQQLYIKELLEENDYITKVKSTIEYDDWLMTKHKDKLWSLTSEMMDNIIAANTIYITSYEEYVERRRLQTAAISICYRIFTELQGILCTFNFVDANRIDRYAERINTEIKLLKGWRKSSNQMYKAWLKNKEKKNGSTPPKED